MTAIITKGHLSVEFEEGDALVERLAVLRLNRNYLISISDWTQNIDSQLSDDKKIEWRTYRQELRDITSGLDTVEKVNAVTWPTKPE